MDQRLARANAEGADISDLRQSILEGIEIEDALEGIENHLRLGNLIALGHPIGKDGPAIIPAQQWPYLALSRAMEDSASPTPEGHRQNVSGWGGLLFESAGVRKCWKDERSGDGAQTTPKSSPVSQTELVDFLEQLERDAGKPPSLAKAVERAKSKFGKERATRTLVHKAHETAFGKFGRGRR